MSCRRWIVLVSLVVAAAPVRAAGGEKGDWELGLFGGYGFLDHYAGNRSALEGLLIPDDDLNPDDDILYGARVGYFFTTGWSLEGSFQRLATEARFDVCTGAPCPGTAQQSVALDADMDSLRLNLLYNWRPGAGVRPFFTLGVGLEGTDIESVVDEDDLGYNAGAGVRFYLGDRFSLRLEGRYVMADVGGVVDDSQTNLESSFGLSWTFGGASPFDTDGDGINDRKDQCSLTPRGAIVDERGCPLDTDGDGIPDGIDQCSATPAGTQVNGRGCPRDDDGDGVTNDRDDCPATPRGAQVGSSGCPRDSDGDGVLDGLDTCPATPVGAITDASGCPRDDDGDGVFNGLDRCPRSPQGVQVDGRGCMMDGDRDGIHDGVDACPQTPPGVQVDRTGCTIAPRIDEPLILEGVKFELNSAELTSRSFGVLERVADSLKAHPGARIEISGHTDSQGDEQYNLDLSLRRAEAVADYLVSRGVDGTMLVARGYGSSQPVADNGTEGGRARNRRVELRPLD